MTCYDNFIALYVVKVSISFEERELDNVYSSIKLLIISE